MGDDVGVAKAIMLKANILRSVGSFDQALPGLYEALEFFQRAGDRYWVANCHYSLGLLYQEISDFKQALTLGSIPPLIVPSFLYCSTSWALRRDICEC